jgi:probable F420-dependent oxidoreductase
MTYTPETRPFRFALQVRGAESGAAWIELAKRAEALGFSVLSLADHVGEQLWSYGPALAAAATATTTLRISPFVLDNDLRNPVMMAAEAATLDLVSNGRYELAIGAGWLVPDYTRSGIPFDPPGVRAARLRESVHIIKSFFADGAFSFSGQHYTIEELEGLPKSVQKPHPPLLIGAGGPKMLEFAAKEADIVSVIMQSRREGGLDIGDTSASAYEKKIATLRAAAGERWAQLEVNALIQVFEVTDRAADRFEQFGNDFEMGSAEEAANSPHLLIGSMDQIVETMQARRERWGISYYTLRPRYLDVDVMDDLGKLIARLAGK